MKETGAKTNNDLYAKSIKMVAYGLCFLPPFPFNSDMGNFDVGVLFVCLELMIVFL